MGYDPRSTERVRRTLLALLGSRAPYAFVSEAEMSGDDWCNLAAIASQHRLEPLLHAALQSQTALPDVPDPIRKAWQEAHRYWALRSLAAKGSLIRAARALDSAGVAYAALKGSWLAWHAYSSPALRPLRDLDLLVAPRDLVAAYRLLIANGFVESSGKPFSERTLGEGLKHLPALQDTATDVHLELHSRLFEHVGQGSLEATLTRTDELLARREWRMLDRDRIAYLPADDTLLHLIVHCVYEHRFDNGPQVLHDIAALLASEKKSWPRF